MERFFPKNNDEEIIAWGSKLNGSRQQTSPANYSVKQIKISRAIYGCF